MRKILLAASALVMLASCKKYLDVNQNPNSPTSSTPPLVLGQSIVGAAANTIGSNSYGGWMVGYIANAGGFGGWGTALTYDYNNTSYNGLWSNTYDNNNDFQYVINQTAQDPQYAYYNAIARIMRAYNFQFLVDQYNDIPYTEALKGLGNLGPKYDNAEDIYKSLYSEYEAAIATINDAVNPLPLSYVLGNADPMFAGNMTRWKQFANTLKLRLLIRASETDVFAGVTPTFDAAGFLADDAVVQPGYSKAPGKQSPAWTAYHSSVTNGGANRSNITTYFVVTFYNGVKIHDVNRAKAVFRGGQNPARNQQGNTDPSIPTAPANGPSWYSGNGSAYLFQDNSDTAVGVLKNRSMGQPIMLAAESYFLQAEARMKGILTTGDDVSVLFNKGINASFAYLFKTGDGSYKTNRYFGTGVLNPLTFANAYREEEDNENNRLVNIALAANDEQRLEAIITQKYIALNMIHGHEAWAEYRRTGYPVNDISNMDRERTFVSLTSALSTPDKALGRVLYPASEAQLNFDNMPKGVTTSSYVFWDRRN